MSLPGILQPEHHTRLWQTRGMILADAGIPEIALTNSMQEVCGEPEITWTRRVRFHRAEGCSGFVFLGNSWTPDVHTRMCYMAGALTRNFIRARVFTREILVDALKDEPAGPEATVLFCPDFSFDGGQQKPVDNYRSALLGGLLLNRWSDSKSLTVIAAPSLDALGRDFGSFVRQHVEQHYLAVES